MTVAILHIDDDPNAQKLVDCFLRQRFGAEYSYTCADTLETGLESLENGEFDAVLIDNRLGPYRSAMETVPAIFPRAGKAQLYVVSASTCDPVFREMDSLPIAAIIDKFDLKDQIASGRFG